MMNIDNKEYYNDLINLRKQYDCWDLSKAVPKEDIEYILEQVHRRAAVKQNEIKYKLKVIDWSDPELRNDIFNYCVSKEETKTHSNGQTLAHWLILFQINRDFFSYNTRDDFNDAMLEYGIALDMIAHSAASIGLQSGFCRCFYKGYENKYRMFDKLNMPNGENDFIVAVGIGHGIEAPNMINPYTGEKIKTWSRWEPEHVHNPKPDINSYVEFM